MPGNTGRLGVAVETAAPPAPPMTPTFPERLTGKMSITEVWICLHL